MLASLHRGALISLTQAETMADADKYNGKDLLIFRLVLVLNINSKEVVPFARKERNLADRSFEEVN
jgi:hypothetical protein